MRLLRPIVVLVLLFSTLVSLSCTKTHDEIRIGVLFPMTGDAGSYGQKGKRATDMAVDEINAKGGIKGKKIRVIYEDSQADPKTGVAAMTKLVAVDKVPVVIGDIVSSVTLPAAPIANRDHVVLLSPTSSAPAITQAGDYVFRIWPSDLVEGREMAEYAAKRGWLKVAILYMQNDYGTAIQEIFSKTLSQKGGEVLMSLGYKSDEMDFRSYLTKVASRNPQAVYIAGYFKDGALCLKQAKEMGIKTQFLGTTAIEDPKFLEIAGSAAEGMIYPVATGFDIDSKKPQVVAFVDKFRKRYKEDPGWVEAQAYDAMMVVAQAIERGGFTGPQIQKAMAQIRGFEGVTGTITFDENGDVIKPVTIKTIRDGKFTRLNE